MPRWGFSDPPALLSGPLLWGNLAPEPVTSSSLKAGMRQHTAGPCSSAPAPPPAPPAASTRCTAGTVVLGAAATPQAPGRRGGSTGDGGGRHVPGAARASRHFMRKNGGRCRLAVAWGGGAGVSWARGWGLGAPTPFYFPSRFLFLLLSSLSLPSLSDSPPSLCFCYPSPRFLPSLPAPSPPRSPPPLALRSPRRDPSGPSRGLFPAAPASRRRVACHLSRTSNPSVRAAARRHPAPVLCRRAPHSHPLGEPTPWGLWLPPPPRPPPAGPALPPPPSPGIVLPRFPAGPRWVGAPSPPRGRGGRC